MTLLSKKQILQADDLQTEDVDVSAWWPEPGVVRVSEMGGDARDYFEQYMADLSRQSKNQQYYLIRAPLCALCIVGEEGGIRLFSFDEMEKLGKKNGRALDKIFEAANRLNKIFGQERDNVEKNFEGAPDVEQDGE